MKLIETPINSNLNLENLYPNVTKFLFERKAIKFYKLYSLDRNQIIYADLFDKEVVLVINTKKKITKTEVDYVIRKVLHTTRDQVKVTIGLKEKLLKKGAVFKEPRKDILLIAKAAESIE